MGLIYFLSVFGVVLLGCMAYTIIKYRDILFDKGK